MSREVMGVGFTPSVPKVDLAPGVDQAGILRVASTSFSSVGSCLERLRGWVAAHLAMSGREEAAVFDILLVVNELGANALKHSRSGCSAGSFTVTLTWDSSAIRVAIVDQGGSTVPEVKVPDFEAESGRGLALAEGLAERFGWAKTVFGCEVWAEFLIPKT